MPDIHLLFIVTFLLVHLVPSSRCVRGCTVMLKSDTSNLKIAICNNPQTHLTEIPPDLPVSLVRLRLLHQDITHLQPRSFQHVYQLEYISIISSGLRDVSRRAFEGLSLLQILILSNNSLVIHEKSNLLPDVFQPLSSVSVLDLSRNFIQSIPQGFFYHVQRSLRCLVISHSKSMLSITPASFEGLLRLEKLDISSNNLLQLDSGFENVFSKMISLRSLNLNENPWKCDCKIRWLVFWFQHSTLSVHPLETLARPHDIPRCHSPRSMRNVPLLRPITTPISMMEFPCIPLCITKDSRLEVSEGDNVTLPCAFRVTGGDFDIFWSFRGVNISQTDNIYFSVKKTNLFRSVLSIINFTLSSEGIWRCSIEYDGASIGADISVSSKSRIVQGRHFVIKPPADVNLVLFVVLGGVALVLVVAIFVCFIYRFLGRHRFYRRRNKKGIITTTPEVDINSVFYNILHDEMKWNPDTQELWSLQNDDAVNCSPFAHLIPQTSPKTVSPVEDSHVFINPYTKGQPTLINRLSGSTPCPLHKDSPARYLHDDTEQDIVPSTLYQPCPLHGNMLAVIMQSSANLD